MKPVNIVQGRYFLGTEPLPEDATERELALKWYLKGATEGQQAGADWAHQVWQLRSDLEDGGISQGLFFGKLDTLLSVRPRNQD